MKSSLHLPRYGEAADRAVTSPEGVINLFSLDLGLNEEQSHSAIHVLTAVIEACETLQTSKPYKHVTLV